MRSCRICGKAKNLALEALNALPIGLVSRVDEVKLKVEQRWVLGIPDRITLGLALSRLDTDESLALMEKIKL